MSCDECNCSKCQTVHSSGTEFKELIYKIKSSNQVNFDTYVELKLFLKKLTTSYSNPPFKVVPSYNCIVLEQLQKLGWDINNESFGGVKLFYRACILDDLDKVNLLIDHGINLEKYGSIGLKHAILHSSYKVVDQLIKKGEKYDSSIIFDIVSNDDIRMLKRIIEFGGDVDLQISNGKRLVCAALRNGSIDMIQYLFKIGVDFNAVDNKGNSFLHDVCYIERKSNLDLMEYLLESGFDFTIRNHFKETPFLVAIKKGSKHICKILIQNNMDINVRDGNGNTALHWCVLKADIELIKILIANGADVNVKNDEGKTPLHLVEGYDSSPVVKLLLDNGAEMNVLDNSGKSPFYYLYKYIDKALIIRFIKGGLDLTIKNDKGKTLLYSILFEEM